MNLPRQRTSSGRASEPVQGMHAVVLGASMSGLLAARVLAEHFEQVTVVERDLLDRDGGVRRGVPQAHHAHVLLPRGAQILESLFPGLLQELVDAGVPWSDSLDQMHMVANGHRFFHEHGAHGTRRPAGSGMLYEPSRPFLERRVLGRVRTLPNVGILAGYDVVGLMIRGDGTVRGAHVASGTGEGRTRELPAELVVAATGRSGRAPAWLRSMGFPAPREDEVPVDLKYVTQRVRFPAGSVDHRRLVLIGALPSRPRGVGAFAQEDDHWVVTLAGYAGHHPPTDREVWLRFAADLVPPDFAEALRQSEPLEGLRQHRFVANLRRRYDKLDRFPEGFLVTGDALCSFNPIYGQGMTVAAFEALTMRDTLRAGWAGLAPRFFRAAAGPVGEAWRFAVGADLTMPPTVVPGARPLSIRAVNSYVDRVQAAAENDPVMAWRFMDVTGFQQPLGTLVGPDSLRRLASDGIRRRRAASPAAALRAPQQVWP
ncbi:MAG TPA: hypothetical protein VFZ64_12410 [Nocardioidaceae bacterium]